MKSFTTISRLSFLASTLMCLCAGAPAQAQEMREFTNSSGATINATILSATATDVTLKLADAREVTAGIKFFSKDDQKFISKWREDHPPEYSYDFDVDFSRERTRRSKRTEGNTVVVYEDWRYKVKIENRSKVGIDGADLTDLELHYNLVKTARANADEARSQHQGMTANRQNLIRAGKSGIGKIGYLKEIEVLTETVPVNKSELAPGWYYTDGTKDEKSDDLEGIEVRIVKDGKVVFETKSGSKDVQTGKWVEPGGSERKR